MLQIWRKALNAHSLACAVATLLVLGPMVVEMTPTNVALKKPSMQVDDLHDNAKSHLANDGGLGPSFSHGDCTHTRATSETWWLVDLIHSYDVNTIRILNRDGDSQRLSDFHVYVSENNPLPINGNNLIGEQCLFHAGMLPNSGIQELQCDRTVKGRFVYVWKPADNGVLTICEFEVLVDLKSRQMNCLVRYPGSKISLSSVYSEILDQLSFQNCLLTCASAPERDATYLQINKRLSRCECIQYSELRHAYGMYILLNSDYDVCTLTETNSAN